MGRFNAAVEDGRIRRFSSVVLAIEPSRQEEALLGYDMLFPFPEAAPLCFQYKLTAKLSAKRLLRVLNKKAPSGAILIDPAFEFEIKKEQNEKLLKLQTQVLVKPFYCVPKFDTILELNRHAIARGVLRNSFFLAPPTKLPGAGQKHTVFFDLTNKNNFVCSEPQKLDGMYDYAFMLELVQADRQNVVDLLQQILAKLKEALSDERDLWDKVDASLEEARFLEIEMFRLEPPRYYWRSLVMFRWLKWIISLYFGADFHLI